MYYWRNNVLHVEPVMDGLRGKLLRLAQERGLTQGDLEAAAGVSHSTYDGMWERGTVTLVRLERIAERLDLSVVELLHDGPIGETEGVLREPAPTYGRPKYLEERVERLEAELRKLKEQVRPR